MSLPGTSVEYMTAIVAFVRCHGCMQSAVYTKTQDVCSPTIICSAYGWCVMDVWWV